MKDTHPMLKWFIWILAALFYFYEFVLRVSPSVMVQELMQSFGITASSLGILSAFYLYAYAPMQLPVGLLMDRFGIKKILSLASIVCGFGALLFAFSSTLTSASLGRLLIGGSSAFAFIAMVYLSSHWFSAKKRALLIGMANSIAMLGAAAGNGPLTSVIHHLGWRQTVAFIGIFGILLGGAIFFLLKNDKRSEEGEKKTFHPKTPIFANLKSVAKRKGSWLNACVALLFYVTTTALGGLWGTSFIETAYGVSKDVAGYAISMIFLGWLFGGPLTGYVSDLIGYRTSTLQIGILGTLLCLIPVLYFPSLPITFVYILLFFVGVFSSAELLNFSLAIEINSLHVKATAAAFTNFLISCGDSVVQPLVGFLLDKNWAGEMKEGLRFYSTSNYQVALSCLPIALVLSWILLFFIQEKKLRKEM